MSCEYGCGTEAVYTLKNGKKCCSKSQNSCDAIRKKNSDKTKITNKFTVNGNTVKHICIHCDKEVVKSGLRRHEESCYLNPINIRPCPICSNPIKTKNRETCSYACSNKFFRTGENNGRWREDTYRSTCFLSHKKECVICGEDKIVEVHHLDEDKTNNKPENLVPLCPTHHQYWHSRYKELIYNEVMVYITKFISG